MPGGRVKLCVGSALALCALATAGSASAIPPPHFTMYQYRVTVGIKGGMQYVDNSGGGTEAGDMVTESENASYSVDGTFDATVFYVGKLPKRMPHTWTEGSEAAINGSWTDSGTQSDGNGGTNPFTCTGTINAMIPPEQMTLGYVRSHATLTFTLQSLQSELTDVGFDSCPFGSGMDWPQAVDPAAYETTFTLPASRIGAKSFSVQASGPLQQNLVYVQQVCVTSCSLAWQGTVHFTRTRVFKTG